MIEWIKTRALLLALAALAGMWGIIVIKDWQLSSARHEAAAAKKTVAAVETGTKAAQQADRDLRAPGADIDAMMRKNGWLDEPMPLLPAPGAGSFTALPPPPSAPDVPPEPAVQNDAPGDRSAPSHPRPKSRPKPKPKVVPVSEPPRPECWVPWLCSHLRGAL